MAWESAIEIMEIISELDLVVGSAGKNYYHTCEVSLGEEMLCHSEVLRWLAWRRRRHLLNRGSFSSEGRGGIQLEHQRAQNQK